ncbi:MFS transporter [Rhizobium ruizarguesonis]|uniref:MFS transporter n=1 Tax=Rhizobium ruizarguesonis TaxID=2081791 RepID=UPI0010313C51|nr:MFS transporter [Rhizobium ruizarguesonis]NKJ75858.1 MFS transporter [Rhizobium leguminosarum bv. viciae]MBC2802144.1 MFS transporter [Rhizobium ruizarguesonis]NEI26321.1 MFS transporter [Rhizobium ruizarguesonis]NKQ70867.1 MFS transporter [Rhizobium ruizarguesonis]NKQ79694.1 MFS transporter [Rhizobium ruizarguesonis]
MFVAAKSTENSPRASIGLHALTLATFFGASAAPTPLYRIYQENFSVSPVLITVIFAVYAFALLAALLTAGSISDHLGRKPVIFFALVLEIVAMALFVVASGPGWLIAARIVQGLATGIAGASLGAALVDVDRAKGQIVNSIAPLSGMAVGAVGTSALIQYGPFPMHLIYALLLVAFTLQAAVIWLTHETGGTRPGALGSLIPRVTVPPQVKRPLSLVTPINIANWTLAGFYLSLVPSLVATTTGSRAPLTGGAVVTALMVSGAIAVYLRRSKTASANLAFGVSAKTLGILTVVAGVHLANVPLLLIGTIFTGAGFGTNFLGSIGTIMPLAKPDERAGLLSAFYVQSYLAFSLPAILAGFLAKSAGYALTTDIYATAILLLMGVGLMSIRADRRKVAGSAA